MGSKFYFEIVKFFVFYDFHQTNCEKQQVNSLS